MIANPPIPESTDGELLFRFVRLGSEEAFRRLVDRHGRLVAGVCRRVLRHEQDVEDAFQATFLVLVQRADRLRKRESVAAWLFRVAHRIALRAAERRRRMPREEVESTTTDGSPADVADREEFEILAVELGGLPETYRLPLILHYLEGHSRTDTAELLDSTEAAVKARLARGRRMLRRRLMRRGVALSVALAAFSPTESWAALVDGAISATLSHATPGATGATTVPLAEGLNTMSLPTLKFSTLVGSTVAAGLLVVAGVALSQPPVERGRDRGLDSVARNVADATDDTGAASAVDVDIAADSVADTGSATADRGAKDTNRDPANPFSDLGVRGVTSTRVALDTVVATTDASVAERGLDKKVELEFVDVPLNHALQFLADAGGLNIVLDSAALRAAGLSPDRVTTEKVNLHVAGITARSALKLVLDPYDLAAVPEDEVLKIQPNETAARMARWDRLPTDLAETKQAEERIRESLNENTEVQFVDTPLNEAVQFLSDLHGIAIIIEEHALADNGVDIDVPINLVLTGVSLESAMNVMFGPLELAYVIEDEVMKITSRDAAEARREVRIYPVGPLLDADVLDEESMVELLLREDPSTGATATAHGRFVTITQSPLGHRRTRAVVDQLKRAAILAEEEQD